MGHIFFWIQIHENMTFWTNFGQILRLIQGKTLEQTRMICPSLRLKHTLISFPRYLWYTVLVVPSCLILLLLVKLVFITSA